MKKIKTMTEVPQAGVNKAQQPQNGVVGSGNISATQNEVAEGVKKTNFMEGVEDVMLSKGTTAALAYAEDCAEAGDSDAAYFLAETYKKGNVCPKNDEKAAEYLSLAAEMGNPEALVRLGSIGYKYSETEEGHAQVFDAFHRAALQSHPEAEMVLSFFYHTGYGCKPNEDLADIWALKANNDKFDADAIFTLMDIKKPSAA